MSYKTILIEANAGICLITMNTPKTLNALSGEVIRELTDVIEKIENDKNIRVVIITGSGKAFVAGADIKYMSSLSAEQARVFARDTTAVYQKIADSKKIFIAAINGFALGGGCEFALACDLRIASEYAKFGLPEVGLGILPGGGGTQRLSRFVGIQKAKEMILTGDPIKASEALEIGLVCRVTHADELIDCTYYLAQRILKNSPLAIKYAKECIKQSQELGLQSGIEYENAMFGLCFATPDQKEGMAAFIEKREVKFQSGF
jgi:enoyl-CoA hydratase